MNWDLIIDATVRKQLKRIPRHEAMRIADAIKEMSVNPYAGDVEKMESEQGVWRRRVGSYRIFYEIITEKKLVYIFNIKRRTSKTY